MNFKKWGKSVQIAVYNGARTVHKITTEIESFSYFLMGQTSRSNMAFVAMEGEDERPKSESKSSDNFLPLLIGQLVPLLAPLLIG